MYKALSFLPPTIETLILLINSKSDQKIKLKIQLKRRKREREEKFIQIDSNGKQRQGKVIVRYCIKNKFDLIYYCLRMYIIYGKKSLTE